MDYYIQGDAAKADKIKAAFERLGYDISWPGGCANPDVINIGVERNGAKYVVAETLEYIKDIIKTHPDYKQLELPVEFKNGDIIGFNDCTHNDGSYVDWVGIYKRKSDDFRDQNQHLFHCVVTSMGTFRTGGLWRVFTAYPATKEQRDLLFKKMREAGYEWDAEKKELRKIIEPNFKVGDWVAGIDDEGDIATEKIVSFSHNKVLLLDTDGCHTEYPKTELNGFHLWTIADAKDGDVLATGNIICIFKKLDKDGYYIISPCIYTVKDGLEVIDNEDDTIGSCGFKPATKEDRELLFRKMKEAGYTWDEKKKELRKIQSHYDIANFHAGMPVLVRDYDNSRWSYVQFSHYVGECRMKFNACGIPYIQCIPFNKKTKHLLGTTDMCPEEYINW